MIEKKNPTIYLMCGKAKHGKDTFSAFLKKAYEDYMKNLMEQAKKQAESSSSSTSSAS